MLRKISVQDYKKVQDRDLYFSNSILSLIIIRSSNIIDVANRINYYVIIMIKDRNNSFILRNKRLIKRSFLASNPKCIYLKIAVLGGSTTSEITNILELFLLENGIKPVFYESEYNQYYNDSVFPNQKLLDFKPQIVFLHTTNVNIDNYPTSQDTQEEVDQKIILEKNKFISIWKSLENTFKPIIIQNNFDYLPYRIMGNKDSYDYRGKNNFIIKINSFISEYASAHKNFYINDINYLSAKYGLDRWHSLKHWVMYKYCCDFEAIPEISFNVANIIKSIYGKNKKGIVLDLDNTLWGGVIGDDGVEGIELGPETPIGQSYYFFQNYLKDLKDIGIILNINSKNEYGNAIKGLNHPNSVLTPDQFISIKANWEPKNVNFINIAKELNLLPESLVFIDDNPAERNIVKEYIPNIEAPDIDTVDEYIKVIDKMGYFEVTNLSNDDLKRNEMYKANLEREKEIQSFNSYDDYLKSLDMKAVIRPFESIYFSRIAQLSNKSNQFNLTTKRYTEEEISKVSSDCNKITLYGKLIDKFGDNGIVSLVIGDIREEELHIELWLMSCRVLKRNMEFAMMDEVISFAKKKGIKKIIGYYYPTSKNSMVKDFYGQFGFSKTSENDYETIWELNVLDYKPMNNVIKVEDDL